MMSSIVKFSIRYTGVIIGLAAIAIIFGLYQITRSFDVERPTLFSVRVDIFTSSIDGLVTLPLSNGPS